MNKSVINKTSADTQLEYLSPADDPRRVLLRRFPYPYNAAMAICSDIDQTETTDEFLEIQRFLNTKDSTSMGEGVGLEIGNSFYFYDKKREFSYFTHDEYAQQVIIDLMQAGYIDCLHSYGDAATSRDKILRALDVLWQVDCKLEVWVNHHGAPSNLSRKFEYMLAVCQGDNPDSNVYHTDVTLDYGIRFAWVGATTRMVGQSSVISQLPLRSVFDARYPYDSSKNIAKEMRKRIIGKWGDERYTLHSSNGLTQVLKLEDGQKIHEFIRYCNHPVSVSQGATSRGLGYVISKRTLEHLKSVEGFTIVYSHLSKNNDCEHVLAKETQEALRNLEREYREGSIYVTTTSKLLNYYHARKNLMWSYQQIGEWLQIDIKQLNDPIFGLSTPTVGQLQGLTFCVPDSDKVEIYLQGIKIKRIQRNPADTSGMPSVTIPFTHLGFPY